MDASYSTATSLVYRSNTEPGSTVQT